MIALLGFLIVSVVILAGMGIISGTRIILDKNRKALVVSERALNKAERALRTIANGAGAPNLEAQIALDEITALTVKELT